MSQEIIVIKRDRESGVFTEEDLVAIRSHADIADANPGANSREIKVVLREGAPRRSAAGTAMVVVAQALSNEEEGRREVFAQLGASGPQRETQSV